MVVLLPLFLTSSAGLPSPSQKYDSSAFSKGLVSPLAIAASEPVALVGVCFTGHFFPVYGTIA